MKPDPDALSRQFEEIWGRPPTHLVRAPGRVNLIGEHIDYCGLPVLPMALQRAVWLAVRPTDGDAVRVATTEPELEPRRFAAASAVRSGPPGDWANYARAAVQTITRAASDGSGTPPACGFDALVDADLPIAAGLSSSSALVVATALAARLSIDRDAESLSSDRSGERLSLAEQLAVGERYVGTAGGGMDQAACLLGRSGHALQIGFAPLRVLPVPIPVGWRFVIAHSGERAEKSGAAQAAYNERTDQTETARAAVCAAAGLPAATEYEELVDTIGKDEALDSAERVLAEPLLARFRHVLTEAARVNRLAAALGTDDPRTAGELLLASHASLRDDYEVSTPRLDALVERAMASGASGARLTGAGLGGCIVALCDAQRADGLVDSLARGGLATFAFVAHAADGASIHSF